MNSDEFDEFIEFDEGSNDENDDGKKNQILSTVGQIRQPNTTKQQFSKMFGFVTDHNEGHYDKETYSRMWEQLAAELNDIGPPDHTCKEWKKIWSAHKQRLLMSNLSENLSLEALDEPLMNPFGIDSSIHDEGTKLDTSKKVDFEKDVSEKLSVLIAQQTLIIERLDISNNLMQVIAKKE